MIRRHNLSAMIMHWFNAVCFILLLFTGLALLSNETMQPVGQWWSSFWIGLLGNTGLLYFHIVLGIIWAAFWLLYVIVFLCRDVIPFMKEILRLHPVSDAIWTVKKTLWLIVGSKTMRKMGIDPKLPPQGFYNAGQKLAAIGAVGCGIVLVLTGLLLAFSTYMEGLQVLVQWGMLIHMVCAGLMCIILPVHIYMAALAPGERPALMSMFTGHVSEEFAKHHNPLWYESLPESKKQ